MPNLILLKNDKVIDFST